MNDEFELISVKELKNLKQELIDLKKKPTKSLVNSNPLLSGRTMNITA